MHKRALRLRTGTLDWEELRTVLAVVRAGSLKGAARELELQHSTVYRRIESIERRLTVRLFERSLKGYVVNAHGETVAEAARAMEEAALSAERRIFGAEEHLEGAIRIATSELIGSYLLPEILKDFQQTHPDICIEIDISNRPVDLTRREADLALRGCQVPPEHLIGKRLAVARYAIYLASSLRRPDSLESLQWLGFDDPLSQIPQAKWWRERFPNTAPRLIFNSLIAMQRAVAQGLGAAVLPCFSARLDPALRPIGGPIAGLETGIWLLRHPDVRGNARVRAFAEYVALRLPSRLNAGVTRAERRPKLPVLLAAAGRRTRGRRGKPSST